MTLVRTPVVALVGNPNCGKTALFNALTGSRQKVANYPGVTVERKEGVATTAEGMKVRVVDLPGAYSLRPHSPDEEVARDAVLGLLEGESPPDLIVCVADATHLRLNLRLLLELKTVGRPLVLVLNMMDVARKSGHEVDIGVLARELDLPVVATVAVRNQGVQDLLAILAERLPLLTAGVPEAKRDWTALTGADVRGLYREVDRLLESAHRVTGTPATLTRKLDHVLLHPVWGLVCLAVLFFAVFQAVFTLAAYPQGWIQSGVGALQEMLHTVMPEGPLRSLLVDGVVSGVGSVVVFLPQILALFLFILALEDSGYMARVAFLMDRLMGGIGLQGRAFIPLLSSFACAVPGIMAARTISSRSDRLVTILIAPLMTCSARLPVYALIIAAFIPNREVLGPVRLPGLVLFSLYVMGTLAGLLVGWLLKRTVLRGPGQPLLMELPAYKLPDLRNLGLGLWERARIFLMRAGTFILSVMILLWFLSSYPAPPPGSTGSPVDYSFAGMLGRFLEPLFAPIGFNGHIVVALACGLAAREVVVAALGTVYALSESGDSKEALTHALSTTLALAWSLPTALSFLAWYVFAPQCVSTLVVTRRETGSWGWTVFMFVYMTVLAYLAAFVTYRLTRWLTGGG